MEDQIKATIASANDHVLQAYNKLEELGATMPEHKNIENLRATVYTLPLNIPKVSVTFDTGVGDPVIEEVLPGQTVTKPADPVKDNCIFLGWHKQTGSAVQTAPITAQEYNDKEITAEAYNTKNITAHDYNTNAKGVL